MIPQPHLAKTPSLVLVFGLTSLLLSGAIFGFFYAWTCSTVWGLDAADPAVAIAAMQAMNASVRNAVFAPAFLGTPAVLVLTAGMAWAIGRRISAQAFLAAGILYLIGGLLVTMAINVPMNEVLALVMIPDGTEDAQRIWTGYSADWQARNIVRTLASCVSLALVGLALLHLREARA